MKIPFFRRKDFFSDAEKRQIVTAIAEAEKCTSGEIRVYVESRCRYVDPLDRAAEIFTGLKMEETAARNAVLLYVALKDRQLAILGDKGIHEKVGSAFWNKEVQLILSQFNKSNYAEGIARVVGEVGEALRTHFPYDKDTDTNELPDDIVFGK
ncbi:TPM domain-containing protein [Flavitalea sp. BT771]|uniref:TPM domain-containing protein n=1 Tax=Flavitalea sp. BT771 TaxID=3063329 RepID=UPI0026E24682|nr:TPM domain-containing protein [Flavitalea sp. BT771]MDO6429663.1 TPM domain-containing protein [Flavitalea sp. BT771]MDV6218209.1 TPM domain-containing protein [Flavitalea sp. BT771]